MNKKVNIKTKSIIGTVNPPIYGNIKNKEMCIGDILKCLCMRAIVDEVMPDGTTVRLNMSNYYVDFVKQWHEKNDYTKTIEVHDEIEVKDTVYIPEEPVLVVNDNPPSDRIKVETITNEVTDTSSEVKNYRTLSRSSNKSDTKKENKTNETKENLDTEEK